MKWIMVILVAMVLSSGALAAPKAFSWKNATLREDGSAFPATELAQTDIICNGAVVGFVTDGSESLTVDLPGGSYSCYGVHIDTDGLQSYPSNIVTFDILNAQPKPPTLLGGTSAP